ncbi:DNA/RNA non-specific endonuclease [Rufibacter latericius]|uniref:DNA/RNA non-specific endonuclease n=1 Tax=Rufibacter latericius TaxID=2487040 RepID=A0A3M9MCU9_9BACT|nr:DNA/RNA non-specific endonuclease [Rufibacter latericius]RNI23366.1 DNA/RNA non-specific endonuclease [Rufibacter latericius]
MSQVNLYNGYDEYFLNVGPESIRVSLPELNERLKQDIAVVPGTENNVLHYINFSVLLSSSRKFLFYSASNIDGSLFKKASRSNSWKKDDRAKPYQLGRELYSAAKSDFDKGHMTKREDVQWGESPGLAQAAADSTFFYSNAVPQHKKLNQRVWRSLEDYVLHSEAKSLNMRVSVFTGPVLSDNDPFFVTPVNDTSIKLPVLFWKVIIYPKSDGLLYRVGFLMSQRRLLIENQIVEEPELESGTSEDQLFLRYDSADTYQVNVSTIELLTSLKFYEAIDSYSDNRELQLLMEDVDVDPDLESYSLEQYLGYSIKNLVL